jgi:hypothetical protein
VHKIYRALGLPLTDGFDRYLESQQEREKSHKADFRYSIDEYALSRQEIEARLQDFYCIYDWPRADTVQPAPAHRGN